MNTMNTVSEMNVINIVSTMSTMSTANKNAMNKNERTVHNDTWVPVHTIFIALVVIVLIVLMHCSFC